jgi:septum formation protein
VRRIIHSTRARLILASASPQRRRLLAEAGYDFLVHPADVDEALIGRGLPVSGAALGIARAKGEAVAWVHPDDVVLAADTIVALGEMILGKAADAAEARGILSRLSGSTHQVITGVVVINGRSGARLERQVVSTVEMKPLTGEEIEAYIASEQWRGKAGAYGIQDSDPFVRRMSGCLTNIVGLPMTTTRKLLGEAGIEPGGIELGG